MGLREKIKILYAMMVLMDDFDNQQLLAFAILRYIAGWGELEFDTDLMNDAFEEIKEFLGEME